MAVSVESSVDHLATPPPLRPPYPAATPCAALPPLVHSPFGKKGKETTELRWRWRHARGETRETIETGRTTEGRGAERAGKRDGGGAERLRDGQACCRGDGGGGSPFLPSPLSRHLNLQRKQRGISLDGRAQEQSGPTAGRSYGWTRGPGKR